MPKLISFTLLALCLLAGNVGFAQTPQSGSQLVEQSGVQGGFIVHIGAGDGDLTEQLRVNDRFQVHGLERDADAVASARKRLYAEGKYGPIAIAQWNGKTLPYIDNMVNLLVAENESDVANGEIMRVLAPRGVAMVKTGDGWRRIVKPVPDTIDDWTHYLHDATGNAVAHDSEVGPPRRLQWVGSPKWSRHHDRMASMSALVSSQGRIFSILDEGSRVSIQLPSQWRLIARDAFNGTILWKRSIDKWHHHLWPLKSGPTQLARRLVAVDDQVYATMGIDAPVSAMNAATGETRMTYAGSEGTEELVVADGKIFVVVNEGVGVLTDFKPLHNTGDQRRVAQGFHWSVKERYLIAYDAATGKQLWKRETKAAPLTLASNGDQTIYHNGECVVCLDAVSGEELWASPPISIRALQSFNFGPKLLLYKDVVLYAGGDRSMHAFSLKAGKELWKAPHAQSGYQSPEDLLVSNGLVWSAPTTRTGDSGAFKGLDPLTGETKIEFPSDASTYWFHHRCYIAKATDNYLLTSRTGIEFVDPALKHWDINHWVRGGCLYGVMPCNGLTYAPPHNCACYPEAKLFGLNALAPKSDTLPTEVDEASRLEKGPAFGQAIPDAIPGPWWPAYRHDSKRSGQTTASVSATAKPRWRTKIGGRLSAPVADGGFLYVAEIDAHTVHAINADSGKRTWSYTTGGRIDSPPTIYDGVAYFGSADGWVYAVGASTGELVWRFRAAPFDRRLMAFEQLESVWPVSGSVLIENGSLYCVAGRSNFLDGGLRMLKLDPYTGAKQEETFIDEFDPETGENLQSRLKTLQMPVGLPDVLSSDGVSVYMRSQEFDFDGNRRNIGPNSGDAAKNASVQQGSSAHLFSPTGYLDDTWFHRSYWVFGRSFSGGHNGYYQAGKYAPGGRLMVFDDENVYSFGRKPEYYRWTTTLEHHLFSASKKAPDPVVPKAAKGSMIPVALSPSQNPKGKPFSVEAWVKADRPAGVVVARGGPQDGYALSIAGGRPQFQVRAATELTTIASKTPIAKKWTHLVGVLAADKTMTLYVNGQQVAKGKATSLLASNPLQGLEVGADDGSAVGNYKSPHALIGSVDEVAVYDGVLSVAEIVKQSQEPNNDTKAKRVIHFSFDNSKAQDLSGNDNHGTLIGVKPGPGKFGAAMIFAGSKRSPKGQSLVKFRWSHDVNLLTRGMVLAGPQLFAAGPPDLMNEEETFEKLTAGDDEVHQLLAAQDAALKGEDGGVLIVVDAASGDAKANRPIDWLPVWDGLIAAKNRLYAATTDGELICLE